MEWSRELLDAFRAGKPDALGRVYRECSPLLARMLAAAAYRGGAFAMLRSSMDLENAILEVFARAFEPRPRAVYDGLRPYPRFLIGVARNYVLELCRSREVATGLNPPDDAQLFTHPGTTRQALLEAREVEELLTKFRAGLTAEEAQLYTLR